MQLKEILNLQIWFTGNGQALTKYSLVYFSLLTCFSKASDLQFELSLAEQVFFEDALIEGVDYQSNFRLELGVEYQRFFFGDEWDFSFSGRMTFDEHDRNRRRGDIEESFIRYQRDSFDLSLGVLKEFWGVAESKHLVDVINQSNIADNIDEESKLGQPALKIQTHFNWGSMQFFWMPWFRERMFSDKSARVRPRLPISDQKANYESSDGENHHDYAIRYSHTLGDWDIGLSYFEGTAREPELIAEIESDNQLSLIPFYKQVKQSSIDLQYTGAGLLLKFEGVHRNEDVSEFRYYYAMVTGFEYTQIGILGSAADLGYLAEYLYDERGEETAPFADDVFLGLRFVQNNVAQSVYLVGVYVDLETQSRVLRIEIESRIRDGLTLTFEGQGFQNQTADSLFYDFRRDDYAELKLTWFF